MLNNLCFHVYAEKSLSHYHTLSLSLFHSLTLSHSHTISVSHSLTLNMLNNFCFHVYAQKSLFIVENVNDFLAGNQLYELKCNRQGWWWCCCPKKLIVIFTYKQRLLSINMKTKVVQHVKSERLKECESERVWECESDFWAYRWKQKLFSMSRESEWESKTLENIRKR